MSVTSKTGLLPTSKEKNIEFETRGTVTMEMPKLVAPAPFTLRPFAGIYNPFPYGCSVLCNHPADFEAKSIVKKAKDAWATESKSLVDLEELSLRRVHEQINQDPQKSGQNEEKDDKVPEELFRKYTNTDSRPITPTPTLASIITKSLRTRRCMTPDPVSFITAKEKTLLVLDLRRSHSQETVYWQGYLDEPNFENELMEEVNSRTASRLSSSSTQIKQKKIPRKKARPPSAAGSSLKTQASRDSVSKGQIQHSSVGQSPSKGSGIQEKENSSVNSNISPDNSSGDMSIVKRRGKKMKKGKKSGKGDKEFQGIPEPGETQVSALESDSKVSSRQSLTGEEKILEAQPEGSLIQSESKPAEEKITKSFLNRDTLKRLQRQLDQEVVDSEFNIKRKIALEEALKYKKNPKHFQQGEEMKNLKKEFQLVIKDSEKWLSIPRIFTRRSARFELPMDSRVLNGITPLQYVQKYVFASPERIVLYNHIFNLFKEDLEDDEERTRIILGKVPLTFNISNTDKCKDKRFCKVEGFFQNVIEALGKVMGRGMTTEEAKEFQKLIYWQNEASLDFRTFTGISATCERIMSPNFCPKMSNQKEDPRHEIEKADFETLDEKLLRLNPDQNLVKVLKLIRDV